MVGNDVVDLRDPESDPRSLHPRFDERVFTPAERGMIAVHESPGRHRWRLWAAKEAAYKLARKLDERVVFSPSRFTVELDGGRDQVCFGSLRFALRLMEDSDSIHAVACLHAGDDGLLHGFERLASPPQDAALPGRAARALAITRVAARLGVDSAELSVRREQRIPRLWRAGRPFDCDLSLSHHGALVAFACWQGDANTRRGAFSRESTAAEALA